jgi:hypothetical protein
MKFAPQPAGSRIEELGDRLVVRFRPRRMWGELAFLTFWLAFWTFAGVAALAGLRHAGLGGGAFLLVWLCGWAFGECAASVTIAWQLFGCELLTVTAEHLEVRKEVGRFARVKRYDVGLVHDVKAAQVTTNEDEQSRADFCLKIAYDEKSIRVGEGMDEREAEYVASTVLSRLRPPTRWGDEERVDPYHPTDRQLPHAVDFGGAAAVIPEAFGLEPAPTYTPQARQRPDTVIGKAALKIEPAGRASRESRHHSAPARLC